MGEDRSFHFRPDGALNLRAQRSFDLSADGRWRRRQDVAVPFAALASIRAGFGTPSKMNLFAAEAAAIEADAALPARDSRMRFKEIIERRYYRSSGEGLIPVPPLVRCG